MTASPKHPHHSLGIFVAVLGVVAVVFSVFSLHETQRDTTASITATSLKRLQMHLSKLHGVATSTSGLPKVDNPKIGTYKKLADCPTGAQCLEWRNGAARPKCKASNGSCAQAILGSKCGTGNYGESYFCFSCGQGSPDSSNHTCP